MNTKKKIGCFMFSVGMFGAGTWFMGGMLRSIILAMDNPPAWLESAYAFYARWIFVPNLLCCLVGVAAMILEKLRIIDFPNDGA